MLVMYPGQKPSLVRECGWTSCPTPGPMTTRGGSSSSSATCWPTLPSPASNNDSRELEVKTFVQPATDWTDVVKRDYEGIGSMKLVTSRRQVQPDHRLEKIDIKIFSLLKYFYSVA